MASRLIKLRCSSSGNKGWLFLAAVFLSLFGAAFQHSSGEASFYGGGTAYMCMRDMVSNRLS